ncbi:MAG: S9 family peptidase [Propionibacteriaceae bacterium]|nr:S9 family peptidase [Propionibacteriaceae bacterium]
MHPRQLDLLSSLSAPAVDPRGEYAVVAVTRPDLAADAYVGQLWRVPLTGGTPVRLTRGFRDTNPRISPDGGLIAFLRAQPGGRPQVALVPADGGEPMVITDAKLGVSAFAFSPDSARLAYIAAVPEDGRYGTLDGVGAGQEDPRRITSYKYWHNGRGYTSDQRQHLFVVDVPDPRGEPPVAPAGRAAKGADDAAKANLLPTSSQLSSGDFDHDCPAWVGDQVVVIAARHEGADGDLRQDLYRFDPAGGDPVRLTDSASGPSAAMAPVVVGDQLFFVADDLGPGGRDFAGRNPGVWRMPVAGGTAVRLTDADGVHVEADLVADGDGVLAIDLVRGDGVAIRLDASGETDRWVLPGSVKAVGAGGGARVAVLASASSMGELVRLPDGVVLTDFAARLRGEAEPVAAEELVATAPDGYPVHGWVVRPAGDGPRPVVLMIHGGPFTAYSSTFFDEAQVLAGAGYAVLMCNPRGSAGYGQAHGRAIIGGFGDRDSVDVLAFLDHALATVDGLDAGRVGVMGGSYGGYLTAWLIAHEHRFAGAIVERGYLDPQSFIGASDIGWFFPQEYHLDRERMDAQSPLLLVGQVRTPTLVLHSEDDLRCPLSQAVRYYTELKLNGVDTELLVFPGENHELSRSGTPVHRQQRFDAVLDWWSRHLPV